jgi:hypothetical protein
MAVETTQQIVREAPELEAIKLNLLSEAAKASLSSRVWLSTSFLSSCRTF